MTSVPPIPARLRRSRHISWFAHMGAVYLFHDLYGYLMEMSPDIAGMIEAFSDGVDTDETIQYFQDKFDGAQPREMVDVLVAHAVLVDPPRTRSRASGRSCRSRASGISGSGATSG